MMVSSDLTDKARMQHEFSLQEIISKDGFYTSLFPPPELGLAIVLLYEKVKAGLSPNGKFREAEVLDALEFARSQQKGDSYNRFLKSHLLAEVEKLYTFFLRYDDAEQLYSLKPYAYRFCDQAVAELNQLFSPTQIERICQSLRKELEACADGDSTDLLHWMDHTFEAFQPKMNRQVGYLEEQVDQSVMTIRQATRNIEAAGVLATLKDITARLDRIRVQSVELNEAFSEMRRISRMLEVKLEQATDPALPEKGDQARQFFSRIREGLQYVDKRLEKLQPRLRQLFSALSMPSFTARTDAFLTYLLEHSAVVVEDGRKTLHLPVGIPQRRVREAAPSFSIVERRENFLPKLSQATEIPPEDPEAIAKAKQVLQAKVDLNFEVERWIARIRNRVATSGQILFSEVFFEILSESDGHTNLAIRVGHALTRVAGNRQYIKLETTTDLVKNADNAKAPTLWEIRIKSMQ